MEKIKFCGGAGGVTGANYILETNDLNIMVDCGLFQGGKFAEKQNHQAFSYDPSTISYLFVTHSHADHIGRIPKLYHDGFRGTIISTPPTRDLTEVMLADAIKIMSHECEEEGEEPLYTQEDLEGALSLFQPIPYNQELKLNNSVRATLRDSAHILGSCIVEFNVNGTLIAFTGDLGNTPTPILGDIYPLREVDYMVMESVYGNRVHESKESRKLLLERAIEDVVTSQGVLIIPSFALERTQELLVELNEMIEHNRIPRIPVFLDSPLAINATKVYKKYESYFNKNAQNTIRSGDDLFQFPGLHFTPSREESIQINEVPPPKIIIAGNPHGYGSRIAHHFLRYLPDERNTVVFVGYARVSSLGRRLVDGERRVMIGGKPVDVRANIINISGYSAHADQQQLKNFVAKIQKPVKKIFVTMGEPASAECLAQIIRDEMGILADTPEIGDSFTISEMNEELVTNVE